MTHTIHAIGKITTPFRQKFGIPRQGAGLSIAQGKITFDKAIDVQAACYGLSQFSHLWVYFLFHAHDAKSWSAKVRPPRLGGNEKIGVFASRSSFRPNGLGMSLVKLKSVEQDAIIVEGVDMLDGTPIIDIKPYIEYSDYPASPICGYAQQAPKACLSLHYSAQASEQLNQFMTQYPDLADLLENVIQQDPRPAYKHKTTDSKKYYIRLYNVEICFTVSLHIATIHSLSLAL